MYLTAAATMHLKAAAAMYLKVAAATHLKAAAAMHFTATPASKRFSSSVFLGAKMKDCLSLYFLGRGLKGDNVL